MTNTENALPSVAQGGSAGATCNNSGRYRYMLCALCCGFFAVRGYTRALNSAHNSVGAILLDDGRYLASLMPSIDVPASIKFGLTGTSGDDNNASNNDDMANNGKGGGDTTTDAVGSETQEDRQTRRRTRQSNTPTKTVARVPASTDPDPSLPTIALTEPFFRGGFRNQAMRFNQFMFEARSKNISQILLPSVRWGDQFGGRAILHETLFDVEYWNAFYPALPRFVTYNESQHYQWDNSDRLLNMTIENPLKKGSPTQFLEENARRRTNPYHGGGGIMGGKLWNGYKTYTRGLIDRKKERDRFEVLIYQALVPSKLLTDKTQELMAHLPEELRSGNYITLHARVEPDMQKHHGKCGEMKIFDLTKILNFVENEFEETPPLGIFMPLNKPLLVQGSKPEENNPLAAQNLAALERVEKEGMFGGKARVFELGTSALGDDASFDGMRATAGSMINFYLALNSRAFIGTPISTYSVDVWTVRFFRGKRNNYQYLPTGLEKVANNKASEPEPYACSVRRLMRRSLR